MRKHIKENQHKQLMEHLTEEISDGTMLLVVTAYIIAAALTPSKTAMVFLGGMCIFMWLLWLAAKIYYKWGKKQ